MLCFPANCMKDPMTLPINFALLIIQDGTLPAPH